MRKKNYCQIAVLYILCFLKKTTLFLKKKSHDAVQTYFEKQINNQVQTSKRQKSEILKKQKKKCNEFSNNDVYNALLRTLLINVLIDMNVKAML